MRIQDFTEITKKNMLRRGRFNTTGLVRTMQKAAGADTCFAAPIAHTCRRVNCYWHEDCLKEVGSAKVI